MLIRIGVEGKRKAVLSRAAALNASLLVSANSLWDNDRKRFRGFECYSQFDVALDSGGFVAMKQYGGYRWTVDDYVMLAKRMRPTWWAQMDFCCEPELADSPSSVWKRIDLTVHHLRECQRVAQDQDVPMPVPVLQGWEAGDYCRGPIYERDFRWPALVGVGSVCRRHLTGRAGLINVLEALNTALPKHVKLHLFGVKSQAIAKLVSEFPGRIASIDSMAYNMQARWDAHHGQFSCTSIVRSEAMAKWYQRQIACVDQSSQEPQLKLDLRHEN